MMNAIASSADCTPSLNSCKTIPIFPLRAGPMSSSSRPTAPDEEQRAEIDVIASRIGAETGESARGHYSCSISFGPVEYRAVAIPADENKER